MDNIKPTSENKNILIMMANTGQCYAKLSYKSHKQYDQIQSGLTIPVIFFLLLLELLRLLDYLNNIIFTCL